MKYDLKTLNIWKEDSQSLKLLTGHSVKVIAGVHEYFPIYLGSRLLDVPVADLNLSVRSYNSLKRAGLNTVGDVISSIEGWQDLLRYRNLGRTSAVEIIKTLEEYQYSILEESEKRKYRQKVIEINGLVNCTQNVGIMPVDGHPVRSVFETSFVY